jgi:hypothetical protein
LRIFDVENSLKAGITQLMKKIKLFALAALMLACNDNPVNTKLTYTNNLETEYAFYTKHAPNVIKVNDAHSGWFVSKIDAANAYSATFQMRVADISENPLKSVRFSAWVKMESNNTKPLLVVDIRDSAWNSLEWLPYNAFKEIDKLNKWIYVTSTVDLAEKNRNNPNNFLRMYVSNGEKDAAYVDDISITFYEQ